MFNLCCIKLDMNAYMLVIKYNNMMECEGKIMKDLYSYRYKIRSKVINHNVVEMNVELNLKVENTRVTNILSSIDGVNDVTMVQYRSSYEL